MKTYRASIIAAGLILGGILGATAQSSANALERARAIIAEVKASHAPDSRQAVDEIKAFMNPDGILVVGIH
ncbi:MAG: hypothetical protein K2L16_04510, partial [Muribaculaceae bacterium]|nr:hypothetical protein [Muribaculaceae bacterium]